MPADSSSLNCSASTFSETPFSFLLRLGETQRGEGKSPTICTFHFPEIALTVAWTGQL